MVSFTPSCMSFFPRNIGWPPNVATADSVETRVRVESFVKSMAIDFLAKALSRATGIDPDLMACLWEEALRIRVVNSVGESSAMDRKWRGAKGDGGNEYDRLWAVTLRGRHLKIGRKAAMLDKDLVD